MYQSAFYQKGNNTVHVWDDINGHKTYIHKKYGYKKDINGEFTTIYGDKVSKVTEFDDKDKEIFESDVSPLNRTLIDLYYDNDDVSINHRVMYIDIETRVEGGVSESSEAAQPITAIAYYYNKLYTCLILDDDEELKQIKNNDREIIPFKTEKQLLLYFIKQFKLINPTIITHWNGDDFDVPYILNRITNVLSLAHAKSLSSIGLVKYNDYSNTYSIAGVNSLDMMKLYKKFVMGEEPSYSLDNISIKELGEGKIQFEGSFDSLKKNDINKFIEYNINDVVLLVKLEEKLKYITLTIDTCHVGHCVYEDIYTNSRIIDGAALVFLKRNNLIAPNKRHIHKLELLEDYHKNSYKERIYMKDNINRKEVPLKGVLKFKKSTSAFITVAYDNFESNYFILAEPLKEELNRDYEIGIELLGAYVKLPEPGLYDLLFDLDLASEYPFIIMNINISPETKRGRIMNWSVNDFIKNTEKEYVFELINGNRYEMNTTDFKEYTKIKNYSIAANGVMYDMNKIGIIPAIMRLWYDERDKFKSMMKTHKNEGNHTLTQLYFTKQLSKKNLLNSFYGVLAIASCRFFDIDNAEAITSTGQQLIKFSAKAANHVYNTELNTKGNDYSIYSDTDSCLSISELRTKKYGKITIGELYDKCKEYNDEFIDISNRHFLFPTDIELPYYNELNKNVQYGLVEYIEKHKTKKKIYKINLKNKKHIEVTSDHCLMILRDNKLIKAKPEELLKTDRFICLKE
jgi:DNA polymerase elongation subunit (family B)